MRHSLLRSNAVLLPRSNITALKSNICCATDLVSMSEMVRYGADAIGIVSDKGPISRISRDGARWPRCYPRTKGYRRAGNCSGSPFWLNMAIAEALHPHGGLDPIARHFQ